MGGNQAGALKRIENWKKKDPEGFSKHMSEMAKKQKGGGFGSQKVGKDGLTGQERAKRAGQRGGVATANKSKNKE